MRLGISVVICTYNGAKLLPETIRHIAQQRVRNNVDWEVIIVDNASTDDTHTVAATEWAKYNNPVSFTLLYQPKQGLTYARELGMEKSKYEFVIFCDDDNWLNPDYVNTSYDLMMQNPSIGVLGGCGELEFEVAPPNWAIGLNSLASGPQAKASGKVKENVVYGAGFVMRKFAFQTVSKAGFDPLLSDRKANKLTSGGDYELCYVIALAGYDIWYEEELKFKHFMPKNRISWDYCVRLYKEGAQSLEVLIPYKIIANNGSRDLFAFNLNYIKIFFSYLQKIILILLTNLLNIIALEDTSSIRLRRIAQTSKILSFRNYSAMKANFLRILKFEQENLKEYQTLHSPLFIDKREYAASHLSNVYKA